ncbi:hypothetical protein LEP1GSC059_0161 [Leptospira noguchii serovar Panama str. CZ214]|uniref:Uncharacterized protein n=1 Tax=Leptospira noguchii serovar Panama str. CZ214 TaxID=1001595 RepID=T0FK76_9LEPT|nr:hypothetical protein LEP1GSC059_0161 [Leptospira noguchii serovar Panama str. CZ214]
MALRKFFDHFIEGTFLVFYLNFYFYARNFKDSFITTRIHKNNTTMSLFQKLEYTTSIKKGLEIRRIKKVEFSNIFKKV